MADTMQYQSGQNQPGGKPQEPPQTIPGEGDDAPRPSTHEVEA